ncbi:MAG: response regulator [Alphaproteobacteria bacterium]|nr:MAG: response regulator [Alphaproteobacteria bacterium]
MNKPPRILIVDDNETNRDILVTRLQAHGYELAQAADGEEALTAAKSLLPDLILLDVMMPKLDGIEVCRRLKSDPAMPFTPIILVTAKSDTKDIVAGLNAGADEYLTKPIDQAALVARVNSVLRIKELHDQVQAQAAQLADWNRSLEQRVTEQLGEIERVGRLRRYLAPQIAELVLASGDDHVLETRRREITVAFCDLRGFTAFAETAEPEEVTTVLREYHGCVGPLIHKFEGTLERFAGDGVMIVFNAPLPCPDPSPRAVRMAIEMREGVAELGVKWRKYGHELGFGVGIAQGYATLGPIGFEGRFDYTAIGTVVNLAARLCGEARSGQILVDRKVHAAIEALADLEAAGELTLKGLQRPVPAFNVRALREQAD